MMDGMRTLIAALDRLGSAIFSFALGVAVVACLLWLIGRIV